MVFSGYLLHFVCFFSPGGLFLCVLLCAFCEWLTQPPPKKKLCSAFEVLVVLVVQISIRVLKSGDMRAAFPVKLEGGNRISQE
jgi:hypothetical protein